MGTRHRQAVINKSGELKVQQYGQWDGYPRGQGIDILTYLRNGNLEKYQKELNKLTEITEEQLVKINADKDWKINHPYISCNCGAKIHKMIEDGSVKFVVHVDEAEAREWCDGFYTIDFQKGLFISEFDDKIVEINLKELPTEEEYLLMFSNK